MDMLIHAILMPPAVPFLVISLLAWRWERTGGALLIVAGLTMGVVHRMMTHGRWPLVSILLGLPALLAGLLFLIGRQKRKAGDACVHPA